MGNTGIHGTCLSSREDATSRPVSTCARPWSPSWSVILLTLTAQLQTPNRGALNLGGAAETLGVRLAQNVGAGAFSIWTNGTLAYGRSSFERDLAWSDRNADRLDNVLYSIGVHSFSTSQDQRFAAISGFAGDRARLLLQKMDEDASGH